jgi:hypothetical protein
MQTFQDFEKLTSEFDRQQFLLATVTEFQSSEEYKNMIIASKYFNSDNISVLDREKFTVKTLDREFTVSKQIASSNFFFRLVTQQNQFLLANGLQIDNDSEKNKLGLGFDTKLQEAGELALVHGISWIFYNNDHVELIPATQFIPLYDEFSSEPMAGINFWQLDETRPIYIRLFEIDGISWYKITKDSREPNKKNIELYKEKESYVKVVQNNILIDNKNYDNLFPVVSLKANENAASELKTAIKTKIDMYDLVLSDFSDNLQKTNSIYWLIENFNGDATDADLLRAQIEDYKMIFTKDEGQKASGEFMQVPYEARAVILELLESGIYRDFMGLNMKEITGGALTNVAIDTAKFNLVNKVNRYEYRVFETCQKLLAIAGIKTENIRFRREFIANKYETMQMLYMCRADLDLTTALEKNPLVEMDEVSIILERIEEEETYNGGNEIPQIPDVENAQNE